jgi:hypothetical protein
VLTLIYSFDVAQEVIQVFFSFHICIRIKLKVVVQINFRRYSNVWILSTVVENGCLSFIQSLQVHLSVSCIALGQLVLLLIRNFSHS